MGLMVVAKWATVKYVTRGVCLQQWEIFLQLKNKVTNYEISKRLNELGFDSESHCGCWMPKDVTAVLFSADEYIYVESYNYYGLPPAQRKELKGLTIKAYDCWDLLMWLKDKNNNAFCYWEPSQFMFCVDEPTFVEDNQPQNALGLAIIKILEEKNK